MRDRANFLNARDSKSYLEYGWADTNNVIGSLMEMADVIDSWSGEYLSKEETYAENQRRRYGTTHWSQTPQELLTMEERRAMVKR